MKTEILYEDNSILVIRKPAGLAVQSAGIGQPDVVSELKSHLAKLPDTGRLGPGKGEPYLGIVHRLDQPVEGVLVFAKEKKSAAVLTKQLSAGTLNKQYYAVLCGYPDASEGELVDYLRKEGSVAVAVTGREKNFPDAKIAKLHYSILEKINQPMPLALADVCMRPDGSTRSACSLPMRDGRCWEIPNTEHYSRRNGEGVRHIAAWHFAHILWILPIRQRQKDVIQVKPQNPAFEKFTKIPSEDIFEG